MAQSAHAFAVGERIGRYRLGARLGSGGAGAVFAADADGDEGAFAVKLMLPHWAADDVMVARFQREIDTLRRLDHPNVVRILDHGREPDGRLWYAMPRLRGTDLDALLRRNGRVSVDEALAIMDPVCAALEAAHGCGVIHRDLKASNVFVGDGDPPTITLLDFGAARSDNSVQGQGLTAAGTAIGTPTSMAPEQVVGLDPDARTDVYAAGVLLFRMLVGRHPFDEGTPEQIMLDHLTSPPPSPSALAGVPAALDRIVLRCLEKHADDRFPSAAELRAALREVASPSRERRTLALHVELRGPEPIVDRWGLDAVELVAAQLCDDGWDLAVGVGASVLGVRSIGDDARLAVAQAQTIAIALRNALASVHAELEPTFVIEVVDAALQGDALFEAVENWTTPERPAGVHLGQVALEVNPARA